MPTLPEPAIAISPITWRRKVCRRPAFARSIIIGLMCCGLVTTAHAAPKTDVVTFRNGDRLTGEVKSLERGQLKLSTDAMGTVSIEWDDVVTLQSNQNIQVETREGIRYLGRLAAADLADEIVIDLGTERIGVERSRIVLMTPIESKGVSRLNGNVSAGVNFSQASDIKQSTVGLDLGFRTELRDLSLSIDSTTSDSESSETSLRASLDIQYNRLWRNRWFTAGLIGMDRNDELGIDLRTSIGAGAGRYLIQSNQAMFSLEGGLMVSREDTDDGEVADTLEAYGALRWDWFRYDSPEVDLSSNLEILPNLTDTGRVRGELDIRFRWEFIDDLFWELSVYDSYDNRPSTEDAEKNDYGFNTSLGYSF